MLLLKSTEAASALNEFEIWELEEDAVRPIDIVEEALIMALPLSAKHPTKEMCGALADSLRDESKETARPFVGLRSMMDKTNN